MTENAEGLIDIGRLIFKFARVNRVLHHEDGVTPETDTDHTVMVAVCACALADKLYKKDLDMSLVAQFAIVHDLVEAYADDTDTFGMTEEGKKAKNEREHTAFLQIQDTFKEVYPWLPAMIDKYEKLDTKEARFVKTVDKIMTKITHILNDGVYFKGRGLSKEDMWSDWKNITRGVEIKNGAEFPELIELIDEMILEARVRTYGS